MTTHQLDMTPKAYGITAPAGHITAGHAATIIKSHDHEAHYTADGLLALAWCRAGTDPALPLRDAGHDDWYQEPHMFPLVDGAFVPRAAVMAWLGY